MVIRTVDGRLRPSRDPCTTISSEFYLFCWMPVVSLDWDCGTTSHAFELWGSRFLDRVCFQRLFNLCVISWWSKCNDPQNGRKDTIFLRYWWCSFPSFWGLDDLSFIGDSITRQPATARRRLVGLPQWREVQLTSHLKGFWANDWIQGWTMTNVWISSVFFKRHLPFSPIKWQGSTTSIKRFMLRFWRGIALLFLEWIMVILRANTPFPPHPSSPMVLRNITDDNMRNINKGIGE